jgi:excisionase family DNA binding protein
MGIESVVSTDPLLKTQQVAEAFRLSVSTVKRLVDSGELKATRTVGRHRLVPRSEAIRFARERDMQSVDWDLLNGLRLYPQVLQVDEALVADLSKSLLRGDARETRRIIRAAAAGAEGAVGLADNLLRPVMEIIGKGWEQHTTDVFEEHRATRLIEAALTELIHQFEDLPHRATPGKAIVASSQGDLYSLPILLAELTLRELGWEVINLGPNLPLESMANAIQVHRPRLVGLCVAHLVDPVQFIQAFTCVNAKAAQIGTAIMLGGRGLTREVREQLVSCVFGDRMAHLAELAKQLRPTASVVAHDSIADIS